jgi:hypothetical protein
MTPLLIALLLLYGTWGIFSVNGSLYFQTVLSASPLQVVIWYIPIGVIGLVVSVIEGYILHLVPGHILMIISGLSAVGSQPTPRTNPTRRRKLLGVDLPISDSQHDWNRPVDYPDDGLHYDGCPG